MSRHDEIENLMGMIDDDIVCEYLAQISRRRRVRSVRIAIGVAVAALLLSVPLTIGVLNRGEAPNPPPDTTDTPPVTDSVPDDPEPSGNFSVLSITASKEDGQGFIIGDTSFLVETENGSVNRVRKYINVEPAFEYIVRETDRANCFEIVPTESIPDNTVVKLSQVEDEVVTNSWAFQTREILSVSGTFPANGTMSCDIFTTVEIEFSYASIENAAEHITLEPTVDGAWEHIGKTWRFTPSAPLAKDTTYTVTVSPGITAGDEVIETEYVFTFGTYSKDDEHTLSFTPQLTTVDNINTYRPGEEIAMMFGVSRHTGSEVSVPDIDEVTEAISAIRLEKFDSPAEFAKAASGDVAYVSSEHGEAGFSVLQPATNNMIPDPMGIFVFSLDRELETGYYRARLLDTIGEEIGEWFIQVNPISAYSIMTADDLLVWTADEDGIAADVPISVLNSEHKTDENGLMRLDISDKSVPDGEYMLIGGTDAPLIVGLSDISLTDPCGYIYTDRYKYRPNDTVNIWGHVPPSTLPKGTDNEFTLTVGNIDLPVTLDENGTFSLSYELEYYGDMSLELSLKLNGRSIAYRTVQVTDYEESNYEYEITMIRNCIYPGESVEFDVKVYHISGIPAAGKTVRAVVFDRTVYEKTDGNGIAHFEVSSEGNDFFLTADKYSDSFAWESVSVFNGTVDESSESADAVGTCYAILKPETLVCSADDSKATFGLYKTVRPDSGYASSYEDMLGDPIDTELTIRLSEERSFRYIKEYRYDPYTKKNIPIYDYKKETKLIDTLKVSTENGVCTVDMKDYELKEDADGEYYWYTADAEATESDGNTLLNDNFVYRAVDSNGFNSSNDYHGTVAFSQYSTNLRLGTWSGYAYTTYKYRLAVTENKGYGDGDRIGLAFEGFGELPVDTGKVMRILFKNGVVSADVFSTDEDMGFTFEEEMFPNVIVTGVYYRDGEFYRMPMANAGMSSEQRNISLDVKTDREVYSPGDTITIDISATDDEGNPVADTAVNISVVNSAADGILPYCNLSSTVKSHLMYRSYSFSTHRDYDAFCGPGAWGGGGGIRSIFLDSPYFESAVTDENGKISVTFTLPDNITEYTITVHAANDDWYTGEARTTFKVSKDFFIQHIVPNGVKATDDFVVNAVCNADNRCIVTSTITVAETGQTVTVSGTSGESIEANFGKLPVGTYTVRISAKSGDKLDVVEYPVTVVDSAQKFRVSSKVELDGETVFHPAANPVVLEIATDAYDRYMSYLSFLAGNETDRFDTQIARYEGNVLRDRLIAPTTNSDIQTGLYVNTGDYLIRPLKDAEGDPVLTALGLLLSDKVDTQFAKYTDLEWHSPTSLTNTAEMLLLSAAYGNPVLKDLRYMADTVEDDDYIEIVLSLGFIASGDYASAKEMYLASEDDPGNEGYMALRAIAAAFIDKENAAEIIDRLIADDPSEYYLGLAAVSYMKNLCGMPSEAQSVTVTCGEFVEKVTVSGLETKKLTIVTEELEDVVIEPHTDRVCVNYSYTKSLRDLEDAEKSIGMRLGKADSESFSENVMLLTVELAALDDVSGTLHIVLPDSLLLESIPKLPRGYSLKKRGTNVIEVTKMTRDSSEKLTDSAPYSSVIQIPLIARAEGSFEFEPVVLVADGGEIYISENIVFDVKLPNKYGLDTIPVRPNVKQDQ